MSEDLFSLVRNCSAESKSSLSSFISQLLKIQQSDTATEQSESCQQLSKLEDVFKKISSKFSIQKSREISKDQRSKKMLTNHQYNYGQITFKTIYKIMKKLRFYKKDLHDQIFYDLGSGSGKVLFAAGICYPFKQCNGIQFLQSLYLQSLKLKDKIYKERQKIQEIVNELSSDFQQYKLPKIEIYNQDFKTFDWSKGTIIFVSSTCYSREVMNQIDGLSQKLAKGTILITLTKSLQKTKNWKVIDKFQGETSWGSCTIFLHRKDISTQL